MLEICLTCGATSRYSCSRRSVESSTTPPSLGARSSRISSCLPGAMGTDGEDRSWLFDIQNKKLWCRFIRGFRSQTGAHRRLRASCRCSQLTCRALCWPPGRGWSPRHAASTAWRAGCPPRSTNHRPPRRSGSFDAGRTLGPCPGDPSAAMTTTHDSAPVSHSQ